MASGVGDMQMNRQKSTRKPEIESRTLMLPIATLACKVVSLTEVNPCTVLLRKKDKICKGGDTMKMMCKTVLS